MAGAAAVGRVCAVAARSDWTPVAAGLLILYVPTFYELATTLWREDDYAHGPIILVIIAWLIWRQRDALLAPGPSPARAWGLGVLAFGLLTYVLGRSQSIAIFEIGSLAPVLAGSLLAMRGWAALRTCWFPIVFVAFMLPLPGFVVDAITAPLKNYVSQIAEQLLYAAGYPVARSGVVLTIGQYQLLVADACSGLQSMFSLSALGLLFMYLAARPSLAHNAVMILSILPTAFAANTVRVVLLMLVTYHFGDAAGQGFLHGATGIVLLLTALALLLLLDAILSRLIRPRAVRPA